MTREAKGALACAKLDQRALEKGGTSAVPVTQERYDRIIDWSGTLWRVQVKYADGASSKSAGAVYVNLRSVGHAGQTSNGYSCDEVDALAVYIPEVDGICWFEPEHFSKKSALIIRLAPPKNGQQKGVRHYEDFLW